MKKALLSALLIAGMGFTFTSCNNGDYDARPEESDATVLNPLNPESGVTIPIGYIRADLSGFQADFTGGTWTNVGGIATLTAVIYNSSTQWQVMTIVLNNFTGAGTYTIMPGSGTGTVYHHLFNPANPNYIPLGYSSDYGDGNATVTVEGTEDGNIRGTFSGTLVQYQDQINTNNKEVITNGKFYLKTAPGQ
jgi:hypothetical protein